jgi:hypothetical protein
VIARPLYPEVPLCAGAAKLRRALFPYLSFIQPREKPQHSAWQISQNFIARPQLLPDRVAHRTTRRCF